MVEDRTNNNSVPSFKTERKVLLAALALLVSFEVTLRWVEPRLSGNVRHVRDLPRVADELKRAKGTSFLFLGNSLIDSAVNSDVFTHTLIAKGVHPVVAAKAIPDGTTVWDWYFLYKHYFLRQGAVPSVVVNGFAWSLLADQRGPNPSRLAAFFTSMSDLPELISLGMTDVGDIAEFALAQSSRVYAHRDLIRNRALDRVVPDYRKYTQQLNSAATARGTGGNGAAPKQSYRVLRLLAEAALDHNSRLVLVAMPVVSRYEVDADLLGTARSLGIQFLDFRQLSFLNNGSFIDPIHLGPKAGREFGAFIAAELAEHKDLNLMNGFHRVQARSGKLVPIVGQD